MQDLRLETLHIPFSADAGCKSFHQFFRKLGTIMSDRGQRDRQEAPELDIVETGDADIPRHRQTRLGHGPDGADREVVGMADDRAGTIRACDQARRRVAGLGKARGNPNKMLRIVVDAMCLQFIDGPEDLRGHVFLANVVGTADATDCTDLSVAKLYQVARQRARGRIPVDLDLVHEIRGQVAAIECRRDRAVEKGDLGFGQLQVIPAFKQDQPVEWDIGRPRCRLSTRGFEGGLHIHQNGREPLPLDRP